MKKFMFMLIIFCLIVSCAKAAERAKETPAKPTTKVEKEAPTSPAPEPKKLAPITDNNAAMLDAWMKGPQEVLTGMACPKCGKELTKNVKLILNTNPPMYIVRCQDTEKCKFVTALF